MAGCDSWAWLKLFEVVLCISCLFFKWFTDYEASRLFFFLEKQSREWPLLNNVTWNQTGSWFADITFGGFTIICIALFIAHLVGELKGTRKTESFLVGVGALMFFGVGMMVLSSFDSVPEDLFDNAIVLGLLAIITGFVFLLDIGCLGKRSEEKPPKKSKTTEIHRMAKREDIVIANKSAETKQKTKEEEKKDSKGKSDAKTKDKENKIIEELRSSIKKKRSAETTGVKEKPLTETEYTVENEMLQQSGNVQYGRKRTENRGFPANDSNTADNYNSYDYSENPVKKSNNYSNRKNRRLRKEARVKEEITDSDYSEEEQEDQSDTEGNEYDAETGKVKNWQYAKVKKVSSETQTTDTIEGRNGKRKNERFMKNVDVQTVHPDVVDAGLQSTNVSSFTTRNHVGNPIPEEDSDLTLEAPSMSILLSERGRKIMPSLSSSRIERLSSPPRNGSNYKWTRQKSAPIFTGSVKNSSEPSSPRDPGYVLHTASKWPRANPVPPVPSYEEWKVRNGKNHRQNGNGPIHSEV